MNYDNDSLKLGYDALAEASAILGEDCELYLVGGSVRDLLLGKIPKDFDFTTPLLPDDIEARLRQVGRRPYLIGKRFGTVGFKLDGQLVEVTTFRAESYKASSRKPEVIFVSDLQQDLSRRDFTFNALALSSAGMVDPFGGADDLARGVIKPVGNAKARLSEDPLRILRMVRFAARLGFSIDDDLRKKASQLARKLSTVSHERITSELDQIITGPHASQALQVMSELGLLAYTLPLLAIQPGYDQHSRYHGYDLWTHSLKTLDGIVPDVVLRWAALLHDVGKPFARADKPGRSIYVGHDVIGERLVRMRAADLKWSKDRTEAVASLVLHHLDDDSPLRLADNAAK